jgi:hypothetical protein
MFHEAEPGGHKADYGVKYKVSHLMTDTFYVRLYILEIGFGLEQEL